MYKLTLLFLMIFIISCTKEVPCNEVIADTYSNYAGYWDYCRHLTNEIDPTLVLIGSAKVMSCEEVKGTEKIMYKGLNCPRNGTMSYEIRLIYR